MPIDNLNKWKVAGAVLLIFLLGFSAGALSLNLYYRSRPDQFQRRFDGRRNPYEAIFNRLDLTADQKARAEKILEESRAKMREATRPQMEELREMRKLAEPRIDEIRQQTDQQLQAVLTAEQWEQFKKLREEIRPRSRRMPGGRR